jgi:hypothetical protein
MGSFLVRLIIAVSMITWYIVTKSYIPVAAWMFLTYIGSEFSGYYIDQLYRIIFKVNVRR